MGKCQPEHVLDETGRLGRLLRDLRLGDESVLAPIDLGEAALDQILDRLPHACAADFQPLDQAVFRRQLGLWRQAAVSDMTPSSVSSGSGKWTPHEPLIILLVPNRPFLMAS